MNELLETDGLYKLSVHLGSHRPTGQSTRETYIPDRRSCALQQLHFDKLRDPTIEGRNLTTCSHLGSCLERAIVAFFSSCSKEGRNID